MRDRAYTGVQKCSTADDGSVAAASGSQCPERLSENRGCILYGKNPAGAGSSNLVGGS